MSLPDRKTQRRPLSFESLEAKASPVPLLADTGVAETVDVSSFEQARSQLLLHYVAMLEDIAVERMMPTQSVADSADQMISDTVPPE